MSMFDFIGPEVKLTIKSKEKLTSRLGVLATILLLFLCCGAFFGFGSDIFFRMKPKVTFNRAIIDSDEIPSTTISDRNFLFAIYDQYTDSQIPDFDRRFNAYFDFFNVTLKGFSLERGQFERCSKETLDHWKGNFAQVGSSNYLCYPRNKIYNITGIGVKGIYTGIRMELVYCKNNTNPQNGPIKNDCIPRAETIKYLSGKRIQMHYIIESSLVDTYNYTYPQSKIGYVGYANTDALSWSRKNIIFKSIETDTDEGFFIETRNIQKFSAIDSIEHETFYSPQTDAVFSHLLGNSRYKEKTTRVYIKIQDIFAMMGGFINASILILKFVVKYLKRTDIINIFNTILKYEKMELYDELREINPKFDGIKKSGNIDFPIKVKNLNNQNEEIDDPYAIKKINDSGNTILINQIQNRNIIETVDIEKDVVRERRREQKGNQIKEDYVKNNLIIPAEKSKIMKSCFDSKNKLHLDFNKKIERKMIKTISFENLVKLTRYSKLFKEILLNDTQNEIFKYCLYPKSNKEIIKNKMILKDIWFNNLKKNDNNLDKVDLKLQEYHYEGLIRLNKFKE